MPVPKRKRSRARKSKRNANKGLKVKAFTGCQNCKLPIFPHQACSQCGFYKGIKVLKTKEERSDRRMTEKKKRAKQKMEQPEPVVQEKSE